MPKKYFYFRHTGNKPNEEKRDVAKMLYLSGLSIRQVAEEMGVTFQATHGMLQRSGVKLRGKGGMTGGHSRQKK